MVVEILLNGAIRLIPAQEAEEGKPEPERRIVL